MIKEKLPTEIKESIYIYEEIIQKLGDLFIHLGFDDDVIKIYENFIYMYTNGFLSHNKHFFKSNYNKIFELDKVYTPMDISGSILMTGHGICRHTADFLYHIYDYLHYNNSQLFLYSPSLKITLINNGERFFTNFEYQKIIDDMMDNLDLFSQTEHHMISNVGKAGVKIDYYPSSLANHTVNIVKTEDGLIHILDTNNHSIGNKVNDNCIIMDNFGLQFKAFVCDDIECYTSFNLYFNTNYLQGLKLLKENNTNSDRDLFHSVIEHDACKRYRKYYEEFWNNNKKSFQKINKNYNKLLKKII